LDSQARAYQRLPARASSISVSQGGSVFERSREYMDITNPGVQKPHCTEFIISAHYVFIMAELAHKLKW
jgi:hypothetical protein